MSLEVVEGTSTNLLIRGLFGRTVGSPLPHHAEGAIAQASDNWLYARHLL